MKHLFTLLLLLFLIENVKAQTDTLVVDVENDQVNIVIDTSTVIVTTEQVIEEENEKSNSSYIRINDVQINVPYKTVLQIGKF
jgi:uncharacterized protein YcfL